LQILEKLSHETETVVREEALKSIKLISENMNPQHIKTSLLPMLNSLIITQNFQGKMSSTSLFAIV
jgi:pantothenate kinase